MTPQQIKANAPEGATHYDTVMFLGLIYIKYISEHPYHYEFVSRSWKRCNSYFKAKPL